MSIEEKLINLCENLAKKYRDQQEHEDLVNEGVVSGLEYIRECEVLKETPSELELYYVCRSAMHQYFNLKLKPVHVPASGGANKALSALRRGDVPENQLGSQRLLYAALRGETGTLDDNTLKVQGDSVEEAYLNQDMFKKALDLILKSDVFTLNESFVLYESLYREKRIVDMAEEIGLGKDKLYEIRETALSKLRKELL